ncbi:uncharacterized protein LOC134254019 [Saccostrea cucullata]|uniref:uncharacterized protein LOC134254019 n=1 Tax=Saccostrea cuccullata TaxID=36930 RepID=UPI002ED1AA91
MENSQRLSEILYVGLCRKIGTPKEVRIRRDVRDMEDMIDKSVMRGGRRMLTGSHREGFRLKESDKDYMCWCCHCKVINNISQLSTYDPSKHSIFLMEDTYTPPGFVRLQLLTPPTGTLTSSIIPLDERIYVSSVLHKQTWVKEIGIPNPTFHGPCLLCHGEALPIDNAVCFTSKYWPNITDQWIDRCLRHMWPPASVLNDILNNNIHCVAIGSKCTTMENELEWRLSFSLAELKLVYTMNHTQFLCYGLLKIFLNEVLNNNVEEPLLCSYFMKTTMFWLIQLGHLSWYPYKLLECFWKCLKYLIHNVYCGKFPNFFIAQNNMFLNKVVNVARESLLEQLTQYYSLGVSCVLLSPTLRSILEPALSRPISVIPRAISQFYDLVCPCCIENCMRTEVLDLQDLYDFKECFSFLRSLENLLHFSTSQYQSCTVQVFTAKAFALIPFSMLKAASHFPHKRVYHLDRNRCSILKILSRIGTISHSLFLALYYYRTGRYKEALYITNQTKGRLSRAYIKRRGMEDEEVYREIENSPPLSRQMNISWITEINLKFGVHYIEDLIFEDRERKENDNSIYISPFVLVDMLSVLSNYKLRNKYQYLQALTDLHTFILCDDKRYIKKKYLSWYILGICQQVVGIFHGALESYQEALRLEPDYITQKTMEKRIEYIHQQQFLFFLLWYMCSLFYASDPGTM